jgi:gluconolactonase
MKAFIKSLNNPASNLMLSVIMLTYGCPLLGQQPHTEHVTAEGAELKLLFSEAKFTEGPAADAEGNVYFTDQPNDRIMRVDLKGEVSEFLKPAGRSNGLFFAGDGKLIACADEKNEMWEIDTADGQHLVLFDQFDGKKLNGPNDVWLLGNSVMYFTDPYYQRPWWQHQQAPQTSQNVYRVNRDGTSISIAAEGLKQPNGIVGDPDKRLLYVADIGDKKTYVYRIDDKFDLVDRKLFCNQGSDGMTLDRDGNLYLTGKGVTVYNQLGEKIQQIDVPENWTANVCFGGPDRSTLFITASDSLYTINMRTKGLAGTTAEK